MKTSTEKYEQLKETLTDLGFEFEIKTPNRLCSIIRISHVAEDGFETEMDFLFNKNMVFQRGDLTPMNYDVSQFHS